MVIELASRRDAGAIAVMSRDLIEKGLGWSWVPARVAAAIGHRDTVVIKALVGRTMAGFAIMEFHRDHSHLTLMAVAPACRRRGVGKALLDWLEESARLSGVSKMVLEVRARNKGAQRFYERLGWELQRYVSGYYQGRESAFEMVRVLGSVETTDPFVFIPEAPASPDPNPATDR